MTVHQLIDHRGTGPKGEPPWVLTARCGVQGKRRSGELLPDEFTVWVSRVTCESCGDATLAALAWESVEAERSPSRQR